MSTSAPIADCPLDLLDQADRLLVDGFPLAGGMLARAALESRLKNLCQEYACEPSFRELRHSAKEARLGCLRRAGVFSRSTAKRTARLFDLGSRIVHCEAVEPAVIETLLQDVRRFVEAHEEGGLL